jgi:hypothetical protein
MKLTCLSLFCRYLGNTQVYINEVSFEPTPLKDLTESLAPCLPKREDWSLSLKTTVSSLCKLGG